MTGWLSWHGPYVVPLSPWNPMLVRSVRFLVAGAKWTLHEENKASSLESKFGVDLHLGPKSSKFIIARIVSSR